MALDPVRTESLSRLFNGLVNRSFDDLGTGSAPLRSYVIGLLVRFARTDAVYQIRHPGEESGSKRSWSS